jgi:hypothetical protein
MNNNDYINLSDYPEESATPSTGEVYPIQRTIQNLLPNTRYLARVRSYNNFNVYSEWSDAVEFITPPSINKPSRPANFTNLTGRFETSDLTVEWTASTTNDDGSPMTDFSHYEVMFTAEGISVTKITQDTSYVFTLAENKAAFGGITQPKVSVAVRTVNISGNKSSYLQLDFENNPPVKPPIGYPNVTTSSYTDSTGAIKIGNEFILKMANYLQMPDPSTNALDFKEFEILCFATEVPQVSWSFIDALQDGTGIYSSRRLIVTPDLSKTIARTATTNTAATPTTEANPDINNVGTKVIVKTSLTQSLYDYGNFYFCYRVVDVYDQRSEWSEIVSFFQPDWMLPAGIGGGGATTLDGLDDVYIGIAPAGALADGDVLTHLADGAWINLPPKIDSVISATKEPIGHEDKTQSTISFTETGANARKFSISPVSGSHYVWCQGTRYEKSAAETVTIPNTSGLYYICYDASGNLIYQTTYFEWDSQTPTAYIYWNATDSKAYFFADERHGVTLDWATHEYLHRTRGAAIANGFGAGNYTISGNGSSNTHAQLDIADGTFFDEDLQVDVVHSNTPTANTWQQDIQGPALIPIFYRSGTVWKRDNPTTYPLKQGTSRVQYNLNTAGTWSTPDISQNGKFGISWIVATNNLTYPILAILGQSEYANQGDAEIEDWSNVDLTGFPVFEFRLLYKVIYQTSTTYSNTPKARFTAVLDLRQAISNAGGVTSTPVSDHGSLTGLADDDHTQYLNTARHDALDHSTAMGTVALDDLSDVTITSITNGDVLRWDSSTSVWENGKAVANSPRYTFSTSTIDGDPGVGFFRYNNDPFSAVTYIYIDNNDAAGSRTSWYDTFDDSTSSVKGYLYFTSIEGHQNIFAVNGSVIAASGYYKIPVTPITGSVQTDGLIFYLMFVRNGDKGRSRSIFTVSTNTTAASAADTDYVYIVGGAYTITMPTAVANTNRYSIKNAHSASITVNTTSSQTIDGSSSIGIAAEDSVDLISDNSNWRIL